MAKQMNSNTNAVTVLPPTSAIKDSATRGFLDALVNLLDARSGYTDKDAPERFITAAEFTGLTKRALVQAFTPGGGDLFGADAGGTGGIKVPSAIEVNDAIDNLSDFIRQSIVYQILGQQFDQIDVAALTQGVQDALAGIDKVEETVTSKDMALAKAINTIWAAIGGSSAVIQDGALASATPNSATATKWNQVQAAVRDPNTGQTSTASILQETRTYASNADGKFNSLYSVRAQLSVGGQTVVGGFGLAATNGASSGAGPTIDFGVRADKFFIAATSATPDAATQIAQGSSIPFMVLTSYQVVNGVVYPPGVYIKKAVIGDATIGNAQIANAAITTAKIQEASIDTLRIQGNAITGLAFAEAGGGNLPGSGSTYLAGASLSMPAGSSGVLALLFINMSGLGSGATINISLWKNGSFIRTVPVSVTDGFFNTFTIPVFDPYPSAGTNTYYMHIQNPSAGPGGNSAITYNTPAIVLSGAKR